jgi:phosphoglucomutase
MVAKVSPLAGKTIAPSMLVNVPQLVTAYSSGKPDPTVPSQRVAFGTSRHRGSAFNNSFNETHILAISQAICDHRRERDTTGPLFIGIDTYALSKPALTSALEVFAANRVDAMIDDNDGYTPTPVVSRAILTYNKNRKSGIADGIVITFSHNSPEDGGLKYNPPNGGPADTDVTNGIERTANALLEDDLKGVKRISYERARKSSCVHRLNYVGPYVADLASVVNREAIRSSGVRIGIDPLGGASVHLATDYRTIRHCGNGRQRCDRPDVSVRDCRLGRQSPDGLLISLCDGAADPPTTPMPIAMES